MARTIELRARRDEQLDEKIHDECGVVGIFAPGRAGVARLIHYGLFALQHRGQESAGIATIDPADGGVNLRKAMGLVGDIFSQRVLDALRGDRGIGHTRYSTTGSSNQANAGPFMAEPPDDPDDRLGAIVVAHNGNIVNAAELRAEYAAEGLRLTATTDSEVLVHTLARAPGATWPEKLANGLPRLRGAFSLALLTRDGIYGVRDPYGIRPLCIGHLPAATLDDRHLPEGWVLSSESCALDTLGGSFVREVEAGEVVVLDGGAPRTLFRLSAPATTDHAAALCAAEIFYIARPDSVLAGQSVYMMREELGKQLAREHPADADLVIGVPESGIPAAVGFAQISGLPYREGLIKNRYIGRTFIQPDPQARRIGVQLKLNPLRAVLEGKRVVVVDDSIVRGNTTRGIVNLLRTVGGAKEVHLRISAPPIAHPCVLGVDTGTYDELIAHNLSLEAIRRHVGADSLGYISEAGFAVASRLPTNRLCMACFNGDYPVDFKYVPGKMALEMGDNAALESAVLDELAGQGCDPLENDLLDTDVLEVVGGVRR